MWWLIGSKPYFGDGGGGPGVEYPAFLPLFLEGQWVMCNAKSQGKGGWGGDMRL